MRIIRTLKISLLLACVPVFSAGCASLSPKLNVLPSIARHRADSQYQAALQAEKRGHYAKARELYAALQRQAPNSPEYAHRMGVVCVQLQDFGTAEKYFEHARSLDARNPALLADMGHSAYLQREYATAEALLTESVALNSGDPRAVNNLAMAIGFQGRYEESVEVFRRVNSETQSLLNLAFIQSQRSDPETAMVTYQRILSQEPANKVASRALQELTASHPRQHVDSAPGDDRDAAWAVAPLPSHSRQIDHQTDRQTDGAQEPADRRHGDRATSQTPLPTAPPLVITSADAQPSLVDSFEPPIITPNDGRPAATPDPRQQADPATTVSDDSGFELPQRADPPNELAVEPEETPVVRQPALKADDLANVFEGDDNAPEPPMKETEDLAGLEWAREDRARDKAAVEAGTKASSTGDEFLRGFCPVALRDERRLAAVNDEFSTEFQAQIYRFSSSEARDQFVAHPEWYVPAAGGLDVIDVKRGQAVAQGSLDFACWFRNRLHMFHSAENLAAFRATPRDFVATP